MTSHLKYLAALSMVFLTGCASNQVTDLHLFKEQPMSKAEIMPTEEELNSARTRVLVLESEDASTKVKLNGAGLIHAKKIEEVLSATGVELVDRKLAKNLDREIAAAAAKNGASAGSTSGIAAQYAIKGFIQDVGVGAQYNPPRQICGKKGKNCRQTQESCVYSGSSSGGIKIYELPSLRLIRVLNLSGEESSISAGRCSEGRGSLESLAQKGIESSVETGSAQLKNIFAPKGYIVSKRLNGSKVIFKVMLGTVNGARTKDKLLIYTLKKTTNALNNQVEIEEIPLGAAVVSDQIKEDYAWIVPEDSDKANQVRLGDFVRIDYKKGMLEALSDVGKKELNKTLGGALD